MASADELAGPNSERRPFAGRRVVLGVCGGIAAYKSVQLARNLTKLGATVECILTAGAVEFVRPLSFEAVTGRTAHTSLFSTRGAALHLSLGADADVVVVAPATADLMARAAQGRADDLLTTTLLATRAPVLICPAMNDRMYAHPQTQANRTRLEAIGYEIVGPGVGPLAFGEGEGPGRMVEPEEIVEYVGRVLTPPSPLRARRVLLTSGPTREALDSVRYLGNRSSGRMGRALAAAAWRRGAEVELIEGPVSLPDPVGFEPVRIETALEMEEAVRSRIGGADVAIFAAAVSDFRPESVESGKVKRSGIDNGWTVELIPNPDIAASVGAGIAAGGVQVGFALEAHPSGSEALLAEASRKLEAKGFDLLVANSSLDADGGFDAETNRVTLVDRSGGTEEVPFGSKIEIAERILDRIEVLLGASN